MSIHIGKNIFISKEDIIAVFDNNTILKSKTNDIFINKIKKSFANEIDKDKDIKSYILTQNGDNEKIYKSSISSNSIKINLNRRD